MAIILGLFVSLISVGVFSLFGYFFARQLLWAWTTHRSSLVEAEAEAVQESIVLSSSQRTLKMLMNERDVAWLSE